MAHWCLFMLLAFALGSIPFGLLVSRFRGVDIRKHGSGNIGATNVARVLGYKVGLLVFILDVLKGFVPTFAAGWYMGVIPGTVFSQRITAWNAWLWLAVMAMAILGHMYSPFVRFKGGKGVATGLGALLGVFPFLTIPAAGALVLWVAIVLIWRYVSAASIAAAVSLPALVYLTVQAVAAARGATPPGRGSMLPFYLVTGTMAVLIVIRHRSNIRRLVAGTESRIGHRARPRATP